MSSPNWRALDRSDLIVLGEHLDGLAELSLLERVQVQAGFVQKQDGVVQLVLRLGGEDDEEADQPAEAFAALIEFDFDAEVVDDNHFEVLPVNNLA